ncbi:MAG: HAD hydrolase-like protein [Erythrobacter sp.]|nr:HAD hydrolase-like protein [Erythrobacter sp.]
MQDTILPADLPRALERVEGPVKVLSLDCFDTLLWRDCHAPNDVFRGIGSVTHGQRVAAQSTARKVKRALKNSVEVNLSEIYEQVMPGASSKKVAAAVADELEAEAQTCFGFAPAVELMRAAKAKGLKIIIVSDTFLTAAQLTQLIQRAAGPEVTGMIDRVFASCEAGISKAEGLLGKALKAMKCRPTEMLHIGDNPRADYEGARALGIPALHLVQFSEGAQQRLRLERACCELLDLPRAGVEGLQPHRALLAAGEPAIEDSARAVGFGVLGPIYHAYDQWLRHEAEALKAQNGGGQVHWLFMLRDAHLPQRVHSAGGEAASIARIGISRVVATGAALASRETYRRHRSMLRGVDPDRFARQMLLTEEEVDRIVGDPKTDEAIAEARKALHAELRSGKREKITQRRARALADRLIAHIRKACNPQPGDTLMLIDLGYDGSTQNAINALLVEAFDCHVAGRYLLLREMTVTGLDKKGLIDARDLGSTMVLGLTRNSALIEQLSTCDLGSVIDYTDSGEPVHKVSPINPQQSATREAVQDGCVAFAEAMQRAPVIRTSEPDHATRAWREAAASAIMRFMFLPLPAELEILNRFEHDFNFGAEHMVALFNNDSAREGLRRRGLFYLKGVERMYLPAELANEPIEARLSLLTQTVRRLGLTYADTMGTAIELEAIHFDARQSGVQRVLANTTYEGFYVVRLPLLAKGQGMALRLGAEFELIEIGSITRSSVLSLKGWTGKEPETVEAMFDGMREIAPSLLACESEEASLVIPPLVSEPEEGAQMVEIVFRPLRSRGAEVSTLGIAPLASVQAA